MSQRMEKAAREEQILDASVAVAHKIGYVAITRKLIANQAAVSECLVSRYFGTMENVKDQTVRRAVEKNNLKVISEALVHKHPAAKAFAKKNGDKIKTYLGLN